MNSIKNMCLICKNEVNTEGKGMCKICENKIYNGPSKAWLQREKAAKEAFHTRYYYSF